MNRVMEYVSFYFCLSLNKVSRLTHAVSYTSVSMAGLCCVGKIHWKHVYLLIPSPVTHAGCSYFFGTLSIYVHILQELVFSSLRYIELVIICEC